MPRVTTWKVPLALWLLAGAVKIALSFLVSETVGSWAGGAIGFLALVSLVLLGRTRSREARERDQAYRPEA
jgi:hypothetical protein